MVIDVEKIRDEFAQAHQQAVSLSIEAAYVTPENISTNSKQGLHNLHVQFQSNQDL